MTVTIEIERIFPPNIFDSASEKNGFISLSEKAAKIFIVVVMDINEKDIRKGDPERNEPDLVLNEESGIEVTFACSETSESGNTILRYKNSGYYLPNSETEVIQSISESLEKKAKKICNGNYQKFAKKTSVFVISLEPLLNWYRPPTLGNYQLTLRKRNGFFKEIYNNYILNSIFENIYILQMTELKTYVLYDIKNFIEEPKEPNNFITEIGSKKIETLPYCNVKNCNIDNKSILEGHKIISYKMKDVFLTKRKDV